MRKLIFFCSIFSFILLSFGAAHAWHVKGCVICTDQEPIEGAWVTVEIGGSQYNSGFTNEMGCYELSLPHDPVTFILSVDVSCRLDEPISVLEPADASINNGAGSVIRKTTDTDDLIIVNWLFDSPTCRPEDCWLTAGGVKFSSDANIPVAVHPNSNGKGPLDNVGGVAAPSCSLDPSDGGQWTHIAHKAKLHLDGKNIRIVECSGGPTGSPECDVNKIEFYGDGFLKGKKGRKTLDDGTPLPMAVEFHVIAEDLNEPGSERPNAGADVDTYFLEITRPVTSDVIYTIGPLTITGGNFQMHCSSCDN